jgi:hypothetical protein
VVYKSKDINDGWDGKYKNSGEECPVGNYVFIIKVEDKDHHKKKFKGNLMLLR